MKAILILAALLIFGCASNNWAELYPHCFHDKEEVKNKCYEMNQAGSNVNAGHVEQLMREGGNP